MIKTTAAGTTVFHFDLAGQLIAESSPGGTIQRDYVYLDDILLAFVEGGVVHWVHVSHRGEPLDVTDAGGTVVWRALWSPFGEMIPDPDPDLDGNQTILNIRLPGQYYDAETGLHYNYYRDYAPELGRYVEADPIGFDSKEYNLYAYSRNNPICWADPKGNKTDFGCDEDCVRAPGIPDHSQECDKYGNKVYLGTSLNCFCKCAGNSAWSKHVRGCLRCMDERGISTFDAHQKCYKAASNAGYDRPNLTLEKCFLKCLIHWE